MNNKKLFLFTCSFLILFSLLKCSQKAPESIEQPAIVVLTVGKVNVIKESSTLNAYPNMKLTKDQMIQTGRKSQCNIRIGDSAFISIKEKTKLIIKNLFVGPNGEKNTVLELKLGKSVVNPQKILKNDKFSIKTPTAIAAVRGTKFVVESTPGKKVKVSVIEGKVELTKRVVALEEIDEKQKELIKDSKLLKELNDKVEKDSIVISENESASINNKQVEQINQVVKNEIIKIEKKNVILEDEDKAKIDKVISKIEKIEIVKDKKISKNEKESVKKLDEFIEDYYKKEEKKENVKTSLIIKSPIKKSMIYVDGQFYGYGNVKVKSLEKESVKISIKTAGFHEVSTEIDIDKDKENLFEAALVRKKEMGRVKWNKPIGSQVNGDIVFYKDYLLVALKEGTLSLINRQGTNIWSRKVNSPISSSPAVIKNTAYIATDNETLFAIAMKDGRVTWKSRIKGSLMFDSSPVMADDKLFVATSAGFVYAFDMKGKKLWSKDLETAVYSTPSIEKKLLFVATDDHRVVALDLQNGDKEWQAQLDSRIVSTKPLTVDNRIYIGSFKGTVYSLSVEDGNIIWQYKTGNAIVSKPFSFEDVLLVGSKDGYLYTFERGNGNLLWKYKTDREITTSPVVYNDSVYVCSGPYVYEIDLNGDLKWSFDIKEEIKSSPLVLGNEIYIGTTKGQVFSLRNDLRDIVK